MEVRENTTVVSYLTSSLFPCLLSSNTCSINSKMSFAPKKSSSASRYGYTKVSADRSTPAKAKPVPAAAKRMGLSEIPSAKLNPANAGIRLVYPPLDYPAGDVSRTAPAFDTEQLPQSTHRSTSAIAKPVPTVTATRNNLVSTATQTSMVYPALNLVATPTEPEVPTFETAQSPAKLPYDQPWQTTTGRISLMQLATMGQAACQRKFKQFNYLWERKLEGKDTYLVKFDGALVAGVTIKKFTIPGPAPKGQIICPFNCPPPAGNDSDPRHLPGNK